MLRRFPPFDPSSSRLQRRSPNPKPHDSATRSRARKILVLELLHCKPRPRVTHHGEIFLAQRARARRWWASHRFAQSSQTKWLVVLGQSASSTYMGMASETQSGIARERPLECLTHHIHILERHTRIKRQ